MRYKPSIDNQELPVIKRFLIALVLLVLVVVVLSETPLAPFIYTLF